MLKNVLTYIGNSYLNGESLSNDHLRNLETLNAFKDHEKLYRPVMDEILKLDYESNLISIIKSNNPIDSEFYEPRINLFHEIVPKEGKMEATEFVKKLLIDSDRLYPIPRQSKSNVVIFLRNKLCI